MVHLANYIYPSGFHLQIIVKECGSKRYAVRYMHYYVYICHSTKLDLVRSDKSWGFRRKFPPFLFSESQQAPVCHKLKNTRGAKSFIVLREIENLGDRSSSFAFAHIAKDPVVVGGDDEVLAPSGFTYVVNHSPKGHRIGSS